MSALDQHIAALEAGLSDDRTLAIYEYFKTLRQEERLEKPDKKLALHRQEAFHKATRLSKEEVQQWADTPIQDMSAFTELRQGYRQFPIDTTHPRFSDGYVDIRDIGLKGDNFYYNCNETTYPYNTKIDGAIPHLLVRDTVAHFLLMADAMLEQLGMGIYVYDGWRPPEVQTSLYKWFEADLKKKKPGLTGEALEKEVIKFVSKPPLDGKTDPMSPAPHLTGGAVDIGIIDRKTGKPLFTGVEFDEFSSLSAPDYFEKKLEDTQTGGQPMNDADTEALKNIRITFHLMTTLGFAPLDSENWHFEMFTQNWAKTNKLDAGFYGALSPDLKKFENRPWVKKKSPLKSKPVIKSPVPRF